jgi:alpha-N-arabinofuranosidase
MCAEGGTSTRHSEVVLRSRSVWGPYRAYRGNPILTQRDLDPRRPDPIAAAGHADLIETADGHWWAVFLAVRPYEAIHYNTGRETYLLPVSWRDGWPVILPHGAAIPYVASDAPAASADTSGGAGGADSAPSAPTSGNFSWRDEFDRPQLQSGWLEVRVPKIRWADLASRPGWLTIHALPASLDTLGNPSFLARRQQHLNFEASTALELPADGAVAAGIGVFQNENYWYFLGVRRHADQLQIFLEKDSGHGALSIASVILPAAARAASPGLTRLKVSAQARRYSFFYDAGDGDWRSLLQDDDGVILSSDVAGGFVGTVLGPYARAE